MTDGEYGETYNPSAATIDTGMAGPNGLPGEERARNIALATAARAEMPVDEDLAMKCWEENGCETGTGGELKVGLADGFGGNIARQIFKMEFILQALTYPEIGEIGYTDANLDTQKAISDVRSFAARDFDIIISYPDAGEALVPAYRAAMEEVRRSSPGPAPRSANPASTTSPTAVPTCAPSHVHGVSNSARSCPTVATSRSCSAPPATPSIRSRRSA